MGYFSNGTEGGVYQETYCIKCRNFNNEGGCAIWNAHLDLQPYGADGEKEQGIQDVLDALIPRGKDGRRNQQCLLYLPMAHHTLPETSTAERELPSAPRLEMFKKGEIARLLARRDCDAPALKAGDSLYIVRTSDDGRGGAYSVTAQDNAGKRHCLPSTLLCRVSQ